MRRLIIGFAFFAAALAAPPASAETLYGADGAQGNLSSLYVLDAGTGGIICTVGPIGFGVTGLAVHPATGVLYGSTGNASPVSPGSVITIDKTTGAGTLVGSFGVAGRTMADLTFTSDGTLYGWLTGPAGGPDDLYTINLATGSVTKVGTSGLVSTFGNGLAADSGNTLYLAPGGDTGSFFTVDRFTGAVHAFAALSGGSGNPIAAMAFNAAGTLYGVDLGPEVPARASLITIDKTSGAITTLGPTVNRLDAIVFDNTQGANLPLVASVLPSSRSVQVGSPATAFATVINAGGATAIGVCISPSTAIPAGFLFQTTDPHTNAVTGTANRAAVIPPGQSQTFVIASTPTAPFDATDVVLNFAGTNATPAAPLTGVNTWLLSASAMPVPDVVALAATINNDGIVHVSGSTGTGVFSVATVNVGANGLITVSADTGSAVLPLNVLLCRTDPPTGQCISFLGTSLMTQINAAETPTFGIFVFAAGTVPFNPAVSRVFVRFKDQGGVTRGSTSVAATTTQ